MKGWRASDISRKQKKGTIPKQGHFEGIEPPKERKKPAHHEYRLQVTCREWTDLMYPELRDQIRRFHCPNQGTGASSKGPKGETKQQKAYRMAIEAAAARKRGYFLAEMGVQEGVTDFFIIKRKGDCPGMIFDFKTPGETLSPEQEIFFESMRADGWLCYEIEYFEEYEAALVGYFGPSQRMTGNWKTNTTI